MPGFGSTPRMKPPTISGMAQTVKDTLDTLKIRKPVVVIGLSMGGYVALEFIRQFPKSVRALGLLSTRAGADSAEQKEKRHALALKIQKQDQQILANDLLPRLIGKTVLQNKPRVLSTLKEILKKDTTVGGVADSLLAMAGRKDFTKFLKHIQCPVLIAAGDEDAVIPASESHNMKKAIDHAVLQIIPFAGHMINLERPRMVNNMLASFVVSLPPIH